jgi:hypothetical protein
MTLAQKNAEILYPILVRKNIAKKYSVEDELAILNNYATDPVKYAEEYNAYQTFRAECKQRAKTELGIE